MSREDPGRAPGRMDELGLPQVEYLEESGLFLCEVDSPCVSISEAVIASVAVATERDPLDMPPLNSAIDFEALDSLLTSTSSQKSTRGVHVSFSYADCQVTVENHKTVRIRPLY